MTVREKEGETERGREVKGKRARAREGQRGKGRKRGWERGWERGWGRGRGMGEKGRKEKICLDTESDTEQIPNFNMALLHRPRPLL